MPGVGEDLADLSVTHTAIDTFHQPGEMFGLCNPARRAALGEPSIIDQLDAESADGGDLAKHLRLQFTGGIPCRLPRSRSVQRKDQSATNCRRFGGETLHFREETAGDLSDILPLHPLHVGDLGICGICSLSFTLKMQISPAYL